MENSQQAHRRASVMLVEPEPDERERALALLGRHLGHDVVFREAPSLTAAIELSSSENVDCIVLSVRAPDYDTARLSRLCSSKGRCATPVVVLIEGGNESIGEEALEAGAYDVVTRGEAGIAGLCHATRNGLEVAELRRSLREGSRLGARDPVTSLPTRVEFWDRLRDSVARAEDSQKLGVLLVGVDGFRAINASFGLDRGDDLLRVMAERLRHCLRSKDVLARWSGDEFIVVLDDVSREQDAILVAERIMYALSRAHLQDGHEFYVTVSIGIAVRSDAEDGPRLVQNADAALFRAKRFGGNQYQIYSSQMNANLADKLELASRLRGALRREEFTLFYQPLLDVRDGCVVGLEALIRWNDPATGFRSPAEFIPILEETGLIVAVGEWAMRKACTQARAWQYAGLSDLRISVNLSAKQFRQKELVRQVAQVLQQTGLPPAALELELTESVLMEDQKSSERIMTELKEMGTLIALDDFGTGYSSLSVLKAFPVDTLKIDRAFIRGIGDDEQNRAICSAIVSLAQALHLKVVAEGVETEEQVAILRDQGCHLIQGFLYAKPMPPDAVWQWLTRDRAS